MVLSQHAIKGNVEAELASNQDAGCGCGYPDYVEDAVVERSNQIMDRLRVTADRFPDLIGRLGELPRYLIASVGGERVGIVHGDPESLAGWRLALEAMEPGDPLVRRQVGWRGQPTAYRGRPADWDRPAWFIQAWAASWTTSQGLPNGGVELRSRSLSPSTVMAWNSAPTGISMRLAISPRWSPTSWAPSSRAPVSQTSRRGATGGP
jgi:hypothetical protein